MVKLFDKVNIIRLKLYHSEKKRGRPSNGHRRQELVYILLQLGLINFIGSPDIEETVKHYIQESADISKFEFVWVNSYLYMKRSDDDCFELWHSLNSNMNLSIGTFDHPDIICKCGCPEFRYIEEATLQCVSCKEITCC